MLFIRYIWMHTLKQKVKEIKSKPRIECLDRLTSRHAMRQYVHHNILINNSKRGVQYNCGNEWYLPNNMYLHVFITWNEKNLLYKKKL